MSLIDKVLDRATARREKRVASGSCNLNHNTHLGAVASDLMVRYRLVVREGADRQVLASILSGLGGCELGFGHVYRAMNWDRVAPGHAEATRLSGLLLLELSCCAAEGTGWRGVRHPEFEPVVAELRNVALAYAGWAPNPAGNLGDPGTPITVGRRLEDLMNALRGVVPGQPTETLAVLAGVHGGDPR